MRLGQLSRKLDIKPAEIREILKNDFQTEIENDLNARIDDEHAAAILAKFGKSNIESEAADIPQIEIKKVEEKPLEIFVEHQTETVEAVNQESAQHAEIKTQIETNMVSTEKLENESTESFKPLPVDPNAELIKAPKIKLEGLKVIGKIELKETVKEVIEGSSEDNNQGGTETSKKYKKSKETEALVDDEINSIYKDKKGIYHFSQTQRENRIKSIERIKRETLELRRKEKKVNHYKAISNLSETKMEKQKTKARQLKNEASKKKENKPVRKGIWGKFLNWLND